MQTIKANFHTHTMASFDGYNTYSAIYSRSKKIGLNIIAITDHDTLDGAFGFVEWLAKKNITDLEVIIGEEVTCVDGTHIIGLYLQEHIHSQMPVDVIKEIKRQDGIVYFPHPSRKDGIMTSNDFLEGISLGDYFEVYNGKVNKSFNEEALLEYKKQPHLLPMGGSDAHYNADITKCICNLSLPKNVTIEEALRTKSFSNILILGHVNNGSVKYFSAYYDVKEKLKLPQFIREIGKILFPIFKNYKERNSTFRLTEILHYSNEK
jgi:hypothetical protein